MHIPTHNFGSVGENIDEIQKRVIDALFHVTDADGPSELLVSIFLPEAQCHLLVSVDPETSHRCRLQVLSQAVDGARVIDQFTAKEYEQAVRYVKHILLEFDRQRTVSNLVITTDGRRVRDALSLVEQHETANTDE